MVLSFALIDGQSQQPAVAATGINEQLNYQARLLDNAGAVVADGLYNIEYKIYQDGNGCVSGGSSPCSGTLKWTETRIQTNRVTVKNGYFSVNLGSVTAFGTSVDWNQDTLWLSINVGGTANTPTPTWDGEMTPFRRMAAVPYAMNAKQLGGLDASAFVKLAPTAVQVDSGSLSSIFINKTNASGNILELQKSATGVFTIANSGAVTIKTVTDSTSGFVVNDANGGIPVFNVDTDNERVGIGTATPTTALQVVGTSRAATGGGALEVNATTTDTAYAAQSAGTFAITASPSGASVQTYYGALGSSSSASNNLTAGGITGTGGSSTYSGSGTIGNVTGLQGTALNSSTGTITDARAIFAANALNYGGGAITNNYGIYIDDQTGGTNDYGLAIAGADTQALVIGSAADNTDAANGLAFGNSRDTNLYRSAADTLKTDDAFVTGGIITAGAVGSADTNTILCRNAANQIATCSAGGLTLQDAYDGGNTITTTDARDIEITLSDTATDQTFEITQAGTALAFRVNDDGTFTDATAFVVDDSGNVGIGITTPGAKLDIDAGSNTTGIRLRGTAETTEIADIFVGANGNLKLTTTNTSASGAFIELDGEDDNYGVIFRDSNTGTVDFANFYMNSGATDYLNMTVNTTNATAGLVLQEGGNVGIGDATPDALFDVDLAAGKQGLFTATAASTVDMLVITNSGQASATTGVDGIALTFGSNNASGDAIHVTPSFTSSTTALTYNIFEADAFTATNSTGTDTVNGIKLGNLTESGAGAITSTAINIGEGWDMAISTEGGTVNTSKFEFGSKQTSGTIMTVGYGSGSASLTSTLTGQIIDLQTNYTATDFGTTGLRVDLPTYTGNSQNVNARGIYIDGAAISTTALTTTFNGVDVNSSSITQTGGTLVANGINVTTGTITTGGTQNGLNITAQGVGAGSLNGLNIGTITGGAGTETALKIGSGWDTILGGTTAGTNIFSFTNASLTSAGALTVTSCTGCGGGGASLQTAYNTGNTITTTDARDIEITLANTATDQTFEITQAGTALAFRVNDDGTFTDSTAFVINDAGKVGIGTTGPTQNLNIVTTDVWGGIYVQGGTANSGVALQLQNDTGYDWEIDVGGSTHSSIANKFSIFDANAAVDRLVIDTSGRVGIGTTSPATNSKLNVVAASAGFAPYAGSTLTLESNTEQFLSILTSSNAPSGILFGNNVTGNTAVGIIANNSTNLNGLEFRTGGNTTVFTLNSAGAAVFDNITDGTSGFVINDADGGTPIFNVDTTNERVGVGIAAPTYTLQVQGVDVIQYQLFSASVGNVGDSRNMSYTLGAPVGNDNFNLGVTSGAGNTRMIYSTEGGANRQAFVVSDTGAGTDTYFGFSASQDSGVTWNPTLVGKQNGSVGIGDNSPDFKLDVAGTLGVDGNVTVLSSTMPGLSGSGLVTASANAQYQALTRATNIISSTNDAGRYSSVAIGNDGLPVMSYNYATADDLYVTKCGNADCSSGNTTTPIDTSAQVGKYSSIAIGTDGFPVISYLDESSINLKVAKCSNASCSSSTVNTVYSTGDVGYYTSIAIGSDGYPVISHYDATVGNLKTLVTKCSNADCSSSSTNSIDTGSSAGSRTSIAIGADGLPIVAAMEPNVAFHTRVTKCGNTACSSSNVTTSFSGGTGTTVSIAVAPDGLPVFAHSSSGLKVTKCSNTSCTSGTTSTIASTYLSGYYGLDLAIGSNGMPVISYADGANSDLRVAKCANASCSTNSSTAPVDTTNVVGDNNSIAIGVDGFPVMSYYDTTNSDLRFTRCVDLGCGDTTNSSFSGSGVDMGTSMNFFRRGYFDNLYTASASFTEDGLTVGNGTGEAVAANGDVKIGAQVNTASTGTSTATTNSAAGTFGSQTNIDNVASSVVYKGKLFVATNETDVAGVYRYDGGTTWTLVTNAAGKAVSGDTANIDNYVLAVFNDRLYIGSQTGASTGAVYYSTTANTNLDSFTLLNATRGTFASANQDGVSDMTAYNGNLIIATQEPNAAELVRYGDGTVFTQLNITDGKVVAETTADKDGFVIEQYGQLLWVGGISGSTTNVVATYNGNSNIAANWVNVTVALTGGTFGDQTLISDTNSMAVYNGSLYISMSKTAGNAAVVFQVRQANIPTANTGAATFTRVNTTVGKLIASDAADIDTIQLYQYNGRLYGASTTGSGTAALYEYTNTGSGLSEWALMNTTRGTFGSDTTVNGVSTMVQYNDTLYMGTSKSNAGSVYSWSKTNQNSYGLKFDSGGENFGEISFVGDRQAISNRRQLGTFNFTHAIASTSGAFDYAEDYPTLDSTLQAGEPVTVDPEHPEHIKRALLGEVPIGVVSENPGFRLSSDIAPENGASWVPIALVGRVPVKVTTHEGSAPIVAGDSLAISSTPGVLEKARPQSGMIVGTALQSYSGEIVDKISLYVNPQITAQPVAYDPDNLPDGAEIYGKPLTLQPSTTEDSTAMIVKNQDGEETINFDNQGNATFAGTVVADKIKANQIEGLDVFVKNIRKLSEEDQPETTETTNTEESNNTQSATDNGALTIHAANVELDMSVNGTLFANGALKVTGPAEFLNTSVFYKLATFIDKTIFRNDVNFEKDITVGGKIIASDNSAGIVEIEPGQTTIKVVFTKAYDKEPVINVTPVGIINPKYGIVDVSKEGFTIQIDPAQPDKLKFNWIAVQSK